MKSTLKNGNSKRAPRYERSVAFKRGWRRIELKRLNITRNYFFHAGISKKYGFDYYINPFS